MTTLKLILATIGIALCFGRAIWLVVEMEMEREEKRRNKLQTEISKNIKIPDTNKPHCNFEIWSGEAWIEKPGDYFFELKIDGKSNGRVPIYILPAR